MFYLYINTYRHMHKTIPLPEHQTSAAKLYAVACE